MCWYTFFPLNWKAINFRTHLNVSVWMSLWGCICVGEDKYLHAHLYVCRGVVLLFVLIVYTAERNIGGKSIFTYLLPFITSSFAISFHLSIFFLFLFFFYFSSILFFLLLLLIMRTFFPLPPLPIFSLRILFFQFIVFLFFFSLDIILIVYLFSLGLFPFDELPTDVCWTGSFFA